LFIHFFADKETNQRNRPKVAAFSSVSIVKWGETFFAFFHLPINTPAHLQTGLKKTSRLSLGFDSPSRS
jgi:hypothetical protein